MKFKTLKDYGTEEEAKQAWISYIKNNELPDNIPPNPDEVYKNDGWTGWVDFIGWVNPEMN